MSEPVPCMLPRLTLTGDEATLVFLDTEVATPIWTWRNQWISMVSSTVKRIPSICLICDAQLGRAGALDFFDACNVGTGSYELDGNVLIYPIHHVLSGV